MSDTATQAETEETGSNENPNIKLLREKAQKFDEGQAALLTAQRENAMLRSGIDLESPLGDFFVKSYAGDPADVDALKAEATRLGVPFKSAIVEPTTGEVEETTDPTGTAERAALSDGAPADKPEDKDPKQLAREVYDKHMAEGLPQDEAAGESFAVLAQAALRGDKRVIVES